MNRLTVPTCPQRKKLALLTNIIAPYRIPIFERLGETFDMIVLHSSLETNRSAWKHLPLQLRKCRSRRSWGVSIPFRQRLGNVVYEERYLHVNPGMFLDLFRDKPDAIISGEMGFRTLAAACYALLSSKPLWISCEDTLHTQQHASWWKVWVRRWLARRNVRWITYGTTSTQYLASLGVPRERVLETQNCVDSSQFSPDGPSRFKVSPHPVLLSVGRLVALKGFDALFHAAANVQKAGHTFSLLVVGEGPEEGNLRRLAAHLGLRNIHFRPNQPPEVMAEVYRSADVFVFPTLRDVWGLAVSEAMWCGLPVLCSRFAGCADDLTPSENRFDPTNPDEFSEALTRAVQGKVSPPDRGRLRSCDEVADTIIADIRRVLFDGCAKCQRSNDCPSSADKAIVSKVLR